ncbi:hypothetical protein BU16DRAFT_567706 [Lophium mytilinum]|uniref:Uncharacterized protein n=1 Tax=Lophium mytilinum TaxID=390894 RepID=A0A6A6QCZ0_9PEZI|nr:hypothetical protein BU16DRAFT_567706 [Lophium mytilinum]
MFGGDSVEQGFEELPEGLLDALKLVKMELLQGFFVEMLDVFRVELLQGFFVKALEDFRVEWAEVFLVESLGLGVDAVTGREYGFGVGLG